MKASSKVVLVALGCALLSNGPAQAAISGINTPIASFADVIFNDTTSVPAGSVYGPVTVVAWNGSPHVMPLTTDPNGDFAKGGVAASFVPGTGFYFVNLGGIRLNQAAGNTGYADLTINFNVQYQLDGSGIAPQSTIFPILAVNGTVQPGGSGFAAINGTIDYYGTTQTTAGLVSGLLDTVTYNANWNTPGTFTSFVGGTPSVGTTPALIPFTTLTLVGSMRFRVDPAEINVETVVPEPAALSLVAVASLALRRRRRL